ncbi:MAG: BtrH N-terminal domain-containing protein [Gemmataceae bacterium]|nr:BtrH N-terminal domain-containing protein [Gemmataceae bacterium]
MTVRKHFKKLVRERMTKTGESYTSSRRQILQQSISTGQRAAVDPAAKWHCPGSIPATTALRVVLAAAGVNNPESGQPFTEEMLFGIAGGIGIGVATFRYEQEDFSSFFLAGRHLWFDDVGYLRGALDRFGIKPALEESSGAKPAFQKLQDLLSVGPCIAWVDMAHLPHRALPAHTSGGGYHVVTVYRLDEQAQTALIGDLTDEPVAVPLVDLAKARSRIKKFAHRLLSIAHSAPLPHGRGSDHVPLPQGRGSDRRGENLRELVRGGLRASHQALSAKPGKGPLAMSTLESLRRTATRLANDKDKQSWDKLFPPGANLWRALTSFHQFIEMYGTGGGLCRPMMAGFLAEASQALSDARLRALGDEYAALGSAWSELADAALPDDVPLLGQAKKLHGQYAELFTSNGSVEEKRAVWVQLEKLAAQATEKFPLSDTDCALLRAGLHQRVERVIAAEEAALASMARVLA